ncbi:MAG: hypothetical protein AAFV95_20615 [Bacteroidota bacterium]
MRFTILLSSFPLALWNTLICLFFVLGFLALIHLSFSTFKRQRAKWLWLFLILSTWGLSGAAYFWKRKDLLA